jgi:hypothetical protein
MSACFWLSALGYHIQDVDPTHWPVCIMHQYLYILVLFSTYWYKIGKQWTKMSDKNLKFTLDIFFKKYISPLKNAKEVPWLWKISWLVWIFSRQNIFPVFFSNAFIYVCFIIFWSLFLCVYLIHGIIFINSEQIEL